MALKVLLERGCVPADGTAPASSTPVQAITAPTRTQVIKAIIAEAQQAGVTLGSPQTVAGDIIALWERARTEAEGPARPNGRRIETLLVDHELYGGAHKVMDAIIPDEERARPGTAHSLLDGHVFGVDPATGHPLRGVIHTMDSTDACAVVVVVVAGNS